MIMFKSEGEMAIELSKDRVFEDEEGFIMKFDPLCQQGCDSPFICFEPDTDKWVSMEWHWIKYKTVKEIFPDLKAMQYCVVNYLIGKKGISTLVAEEIFAMDSNCFWIKGSDGEQTRGFNPRAVFDPRTELSIYADVDEFTIEKYGDSYLAGK